MTGTPPTFGRLVLCLVLAVALAGCTARTRGPQEPDEPADPVPVVTLAPGQTLAPGETLPPPVDEPDAPDDADDADDADDDDGDIPFDPDAPYVEAPMLRIQLAQFPDGRSVGFMIADLQEYYYDQDLEVLVEPAIPGDVDPIDAVLAEEGPQFLFASAALVMAANARGADLVNIAQILQRSGQRIASLASEPVSDVAALTAGQLLVLPHGRSADALASLTAAGLSPTDVETIDSPFDPEGFVEGNLPAQITYEDEYAQILETYVDEDEDDLVAPGDLVMIDLSTPELTTLQEGIYARASWLAETGNDQIAVRFLTAAFQGWIYCRTELDECAQLAYESGGQRETQHQRWVVNEVNALVWPSANGIGSIDPAAWEQTAQRVLAAGLIDSLPAANAVRTDLAAAALAQLGDVDAMGAGFARATVEITAGGEDPASE